MELNKEEFKSFKKCIRKTYFNDDEQNIIYSVDGWKGYPSLRNDDEYEIFDKELDTFIKNVNEKLLNLVIV